MLTDRLLPEAFRPVVERFVSAFRPLGKGSFTADMAEFSSSFIPPLSRGNAEESAATIAPASLRDALQRWMDRQRDGWQIVPPALVIYRTSIDVAGTTYRPVNVARGDSYVLIGTEADWRPAQIRSVFQIKRRCNDGEETTTLLCVSGFLPLSRIDATFDAYTTFPHAGGRIYYSEETPEEVISQDEVLSHFAYTPNVCERIQAEHFHALPLTRVSLFSLPFHATTHFPNTTQS